ncbi:hypothetical protein RJ640_009961 [Escallonia rubra]|uniref:Uncharacterized protein n=1 Tax=Escallonia rubra TaxID=112253 RepID=A0AA88RP40_9ASTE|nr:hypothetical protein RJ640_009961 [Escallonia rubra]
MVVSTNPDLRPEMKLNPEINGVNGSESNPTSTTDPHSTRVFFDNKSHFVDPDPGHSFQAIRAQIFGSNDTFLNPTPFRLSYAKKTEVHWLQSVYLKLASHSTGAPCTASPFFTHRRTNPLALTFSRQPWLLTHEPITRGGGASSWVCWLWWSELGEEANASAAASRRRRFSITSNEGMLLVAPCEVAEWT